MQGEPTGTVSIGYGNSSGHFILYRTFEFSSLASEYKYY